MTWVTPRVWVAGERVTATKMNEISTDFNEIKTYMDSYGDTELAALAGLTSAANSFPYFTGSGTASLLTIVSAIRTVLASADLTTFRSNAGLGIGVDVQAYNSNLTSWATFSTPGAGSAVVGTQDTQTLTNKRVTPLGNSYFGTGSTYTPDASHNHCTIYDQSLNFTIANPTGTPLVAQQLLFSIRDNGTPRTISWGTNYKAGGVALPSTTVASKTKHLLFVYDYYISSKYMLVWTAQEA